MLSHLLLYSDRFKYRMSPTTIILLNNHVCNNLIIISSTRCLASTSEELHPKGAKSANGEGWTMLQQSCTGRMRKHLWILDVCITHPNAFQTWQLQLTDSYRGVRLKRKLNMALKLPIQSELLLCALLLWRQPDVASYTRDWLN